MRTPIGMHYKFSDERIVYKMNADENGNLYVPVSGRNHSNSPTASYDWMVSVDGDTSVNYSGTGSDGGAITLSGYTAGSNHIITITPTTEEYGWALAYGWNNTTCAPLLTSVHYDGSYMGYGSSATQTGSYFRAYQYKGCTSLTTAPQETIPDTVTTLTGYFRYCQYQGCSSLISTPDEVLPNGVTIIGSYFRAYQYRGCTLLVTASNEVLSNSVTSIDNNFRYYQYYQCTSLVTAADEALPNGITSIGNSFRALQYYGCSSLVTAADEVLPNSVTSIGSNFRSNQYYGCRLLITAAEEVMPDGVTSIGGYFRDRQYQNCSSLTSAKLIAKNFENPYDKRYQQFSGAGNTTNPMVITIYGNEMEADMATNSCGLANANVSFIYVQPDLVEQYQQAAIRSNIDDVKFGPIEEIIYKMNADDSGNLYVPVGGYNRSASSRNATYNWNVAVDGDNATNYNGTGSAGGSITLSGYAPGTNHTIKITPNNAAYGWALAYGWYETAGVLYLTEVLYDGSYVGYGSSATSTGGSFRMHQYHGCASLTVAPVEVIPDGVTSVGQYFRGQQYYGCSSLAAAPNEVLPATVTSIGSNFRMSQYCGCSSLAIAPTSEVFPSGIDSVGKYFRAYQYQDCSSLISVPNETIPNTVTSIGDQFRYQQYYQCGSVVSTGVESIPDTLTSIGNDFRYRQYSTCTSLTTVSGRKDPVVDSVGNRYRNSQFYGMLNNKLTITVLSDVGPEGGSNTLYDNSVLSVQVPSAYLQNYIDATTLPRSNITDSKFVGY